MSRSVVASGVLYKHDFMGRIYHKILLKSTGKYYATYYTSIPAAVILSRLIIGTKHNSWNFTDLESIKNLRIVDPACGSGTLLSGIYTAIRDIACGYLTSGEIKQLHKILVEKVIYGYDVLDYATHLTLTSLDHVKISPPECSIGI